MKAQPTQKDFISLLKRKNKARGAIDRLKTHYRPLICPFGTILELVEPYKSVFDIGYGSGQFLLLITAFKEPLAIGGLELSEKLAANARALLKDYEVPAYFLVSEGSSIPSEVSEYDYVTLIDVLHHIHVNKQFSYLSEIASAMKSGSRLLLKDIDRSSLWVYGNKLHDLILTGEPGYEIRKNTARKYLENAGLKIIGTYTQRMLWYPHYLFEAEKP